MVFQPQEIDRFIDMFYRVKPEIERFPGCSQVKLLRSLENPAECFTWSIWKDQASLEAYRNSPFFRKTWRETKKRFAAKPQAWSLTYVEPPQEGDGSLSG